MSGSTTVGIDLDFINEISAVEILRGDTLWNEIRQIFPIKRKVLYRKTHLTYDVGMIKHYVLYSNSNMAIYFTHDVLCHCSVLVIFAGHKLVTFPKCF